MNVFDLVFLAAFAMSVSILISAALAAIRGQVPRAFAILRGWLIGAALYMGTSLAVAYAAPQRILQVGEAWCFDDWCLTAKGGQRPDASHTDANYTVDLLISSRAKRVAQRAKGAWIYLRDENGRHYDPTPDPADVPLDVVLEPGESVAAKRRFKVPADIRQLGLVTGHGGPPCGLMSLVIIGQASCLFHKETMIRLPVE